MIFSNVRPTKREEYLNLLKQYVKVPKGQELPQDFSALRSDGTGWVGGLGSVHYYCYYC